ncbi:hypothetical protein RHECNPAF_14110067 [Rhizobium etli CNPAF512]|nr:hypothetical protein RHECNPAF_14110067 [Rhizobium etli CNPAF512]
MPQLGISSSENDLFINQAKEPLSYTRYPSPGSGSMADPRGSGQVQHGRAQLEKFFDNVIPAIFVGAGD